MFMSFQPLVALVLHQLELAALYDDDVLYFAWHGAALEAPSLRSVTIIVLPHQLWLCFLASVEADLQQLMKNLKIVVCMDAETCVHVHWPRHEDCCFH